MKKIVLILIMITFGFSQIVDRVVASVNNMPITSYDISKTIKEYNISPSEALNMLIDKKILNEAIEKNGISVDDFDIENAIEKIARKNGMSVFEFKALLKQKGEYQKFIDNLKNNLLKEKLFSQIVNSKLKISDEEIKNYYQNHKNEFTTFKTVQVVAYYANNPETLKNIQKSPLMNNNVLSKVKVYSYNELPKNLLYLFNNTKVGYFTPILNNGTNFVMFYVARKDGKIILPLKEVKSLIAEKIATEKRNQILNQYFAQLKHQAEIKIFK